MTSINKKWKKIQARRRKQETFKNTQRSRLEIKKREKKPLQHQMGDRQKGGEAIRDRRESVQTLLARKKLSILRSAPSFKKKKNIEICDIACTISDFN